MTLGGAFSASSCMIFTVVKINRTEFCIYSNALWAPPWDFPFWFSSCWPILGFSFCKPSIKSMGRLAHINAIPASVFAIIAAFNEAAYTARRFGQPFFPDPRVRSKRSQSGNDQSPSLSAEPSFRCSRLWQHRLWSTPHRLDREHLALQCGRRKSLPRLSIGESDYRYFERFISVSIIYWIVLLSLIEQIGRAVEKAMDIKRPANLGQNGASAKEVGWWLNFPVKQNFPRPGLG